MYTFFAVNCCLCGIPDINLDQSAVGSSSAGILLFIVHQADRPQIDNWHCSACRNYAFKYELIMKPVYVRRPFTVYAC